jgi:hypothetical protein
MTDLLDKLVIGTAAWGEEPYGVKRSHPTTQEKAAIMEQANLMGVRRYHIKPAYRAHVPRVNYRYKVYSEEGAYTLDDARAELECGNKTILIPYNPHKQWVLEGLGRIPHDVDVCVFSIFMQGTLVDSMYEECVMSAFTHPMIDHVVVGINNGLELARLIDTLYREKEMRKHQWWRDHGFRSLCLGDCPETDPRTW